MKLNSNLLEAISFLVYPIDHKNDRLILDPAMPSKEAMPNLIF